MRTWCFSLSLDLLLSDATRGVPSRAGSGRAGSGSAQKLHVILQGGVWLRKRHFQLAGCSIWKLTIALSLSLSRNCRLAVSFFTHRSCGSFRIVTRCSSDNGRHSVCATGGQAGCSSGGGERRSGWCSNWAEYRRQGRQQTTPVRLYMQTYLELLFSLFERLEYPVTHYLVPKDIFLLNIQWLLLLLCYTYAKVAFRCCCRHSAAAACQHPFINPNIKTKSHESCEWTAELCSAAKWLLPFDFP